MQETIFKATIRRFFSVLATVLGFLVAFILIILLSSLFQKDSAVEIKHKLNAEIQPNAQGVRKDLTSSAPVILRIDIDGIIGTDSLNRETVNQQLIESREKPFDDNQVKAILLSINTPGGTVTDGDGIYNALKRYKDKYNVPIYAHVDGLCASGGMYIACAADKIYATNSSVVGSIGVIAPPAFNFTQLMEKIGVDSKTLIAGKGKDELNPFRPWKPDEGKNYQMLIDYFYRLFVNIIIENRKSIDKEKLIADYGADVFPAEKGMELGFIDGANQTYNETLSMLAKEIGVQEDEYRVITLTKETWITSLFNAENMGQIFKGTIKHQLEIPGQLDSRLANQFLYLYQIHE